MAKKFYITTSIAYVNAEPHIGFAQELLGADVVARYHRNVKKDDTFFLTGTDEHGASVSRAAEKEGLSTQEFSQKISDQFDNLCQLLNISNDGFVRTTDPEHIKNVTNIWEKCFQTGDIYKKKYQGLYCVGCEAFINEKDLIDGRCSNHPNLTPEKIEEENWFFKLSKYQKKLLKHYQENPDFVQPEVRFNEIRRLVESGLEDVSISRPKEKLAWGIEVPNDPAHVMYVWFDALTNYLYPQKYWPADLHIIGKDILRFHAALWPAMLWSAGYDLPKKIFVHGFISASGKKMSKTLGNVIKPQEMIDKFGVETTRYLLLRELIFSADSDFSWEKMARRYNADLANDLGNLLQRTLVMINNYNIEVKPEKISEVSSRLSKESVYQAIEALRFESSLEKIFNNISYLNKFIDNNKPWDLAKSDIKKCTEVLQSIYEYLILIAELLEPFMPETSQKMQNQLKTLKPEPLFPKLVIRN